MSKQSEVVTVNQRAKYVTLLTALLLVWGITVAIYIVYKCRATDNLAKQSQSSTTQSVEAPLPRPSYSPQSVASAYNDLLSAKNSSQKDASVTELILAFNDNPSVATNPMKKSIVTALPDVSDPVIPLSFFAQHGSQADAAMLVEEYPMIENVAMRKAVAQTAYVIDKKLSARLAEESVAKNALYIEFLATIKALGYKRDN